MRARQGSKTLPNQLMSAFALTLVRPCVQLRPGTRIFLPLFSGVGSASQSRPRRVEEPRFQRRDLYLGTSRSPLKFRTFSTPAVMSITADSKCVGCEGIGQAMSEEELNAHLPLVPDWTVNEDRTELLLSFRTKNFAAALDFVNRVGAIAEAENHHPDIGIKSWNQVHISMSTHSLGGITSNDIIMAVKIDTLPVEKKPLKKPSKSA